MASLRRRLKAWLARSKQLASDVIGNQLAAMSLDGYFQLGRKQYRQEGMLDFLYRTFGYGKQNYPKSSLAVLMFLLKLPINIVKIVTEVLPHFVCVISALLLGAVIRLTIERILEPLLDKKISIAKVVAAVIIAPIAFAIALLLAVIAAVAAMCYYIGRAVTSPIDSACEDWACWNESNPQRPWLNLAIRLFFTGLRVLTTATVYGLIVVFALPALAGLLSPLGAAALLPIVHGLTGATAAVLHTLSTIVPAIGLIPAMTAQLMLLGMVIGGAIAALGTIIRLWICPPKPAPVHPRDEFKESVESGANSLYDIYVNPANGSILLENDIADYFLEDNVRDYTRVPGVSMTRVNELQRLQPAERLEQREITSVVPAKVSAQGLFAVPTTSAVVLDDREAREAAALAYYNQTYDLL